ncbi:MAG: ATP-dependent Clp protease ATP-binding subunit, partial [Bryobacterales bacterium]|nr:ATP-dependent Clp protease ATP-binding subunit [Bryobacterales bacterium]
PGVGKTELAKALADVLYGGGDSLLFFSLADLGKSQFAASTLFGAPRGHVGGEGSLTSALLRSPNSVVLLDEIEKAHPDVMKRFLSAWNDGFLTDQQNGLKVPTNGAIFILTSNANSREIGELAEAHTGTLDELNRKVKDLLSVGDSALAPEVLSRIDTVFTFSPMKGIDIAYVVALQIERLAKSYGLEVAEGGIRKEILIDAVQRLQKTGTKGGV